ncbi:g9396 [Coccomyxa elongata]
MDGHNEQINANVNVGGYGGPGNEVDMDQACTEKCSIPSPSVSPMELPMTMAPTTEASPAALKLPARALVPLTLAVLAAQLDTFSVQLPAGTCCAVQGMLTSTDHGPAKESVTARIMVLPPVLCNGAITQQIRTGVSDSILFIGSVWPAWQTQANNGSLEKKTPDLDVLSPIYVAHGHLMDATKFHLNECRGVRDDWRIEPTSEYLDRISALQLACMSLEDLFIHGHGDDLREHHCTVMGAKSVYHITLVIFREFNIFKIFKKAKNSVNRECRRGGAGAGAEALLLLHGTQQPIYLANPE